MTAYDTWKLDNGEPIEGDCVIHGTIISWEDEACRFYWKLQLDDGSTVERQAGCEITESLDINEVLDVFDDYDFLTSVHVDDIVYVTIQG